MPDIKKVYTKYKNKSFKVISISTDKEQNIENWKQQIKKLKMNWENYIDLEEKIAKENNITSFPTIFLIDKNEVLIKKFTHF